MKNINSNDIYKKHLKNDLRYINLMFPLFKHKAIKDLGEDVSEMTIAMYCRQLLKLYLNSKKVYTLEEIKQKLKNIGYDLNS